MRGKQVLTVAAALIAALAVQVPARAAGMAVKPKPALKAPPPVGGVFWIQGEYLLWATKGDRLPPLVTTSPPGTPLAQAGLLGAPGTTVLFGDESVNGKLRSGGRISGGYWFDPTRARGIEAQFFALTDARTNFGAVSDGTTILAHPFINTFTDAPDAFLVAYPGTVAGGTTISERSGLLGGGIDYRQILCSVCFGSDRIDGLIGYRALRLDDRFDLSSTSVVLGNTNLPIGSTVVARDAFRTENTFHGLDLGLKGAVMRGPWSLEWIAKVALGVSVREVSIDGFTALTTAGAVTSPGGIYTQPSNIGRTSSDRFAVVPEINLNLGYQIAPQWRAFIGYDLIYWSNVIRPGTAIDTVINTSQIGGGAPAGPARPAPNFSATDYWAQGLNVGLKFRY